MASLCDGAAATPGIGSADAGAGGSPRTASQKLKLNSKIMKSAKNFFTTIAIAISSAMLSGCVLIPIAGFGYTGYQYHEKEGVFAPGQPLGGPGPADKDDKSSSNSTSKPPPPQTNNNIE